MDDQTKLKFAAQADSIIQKYGKRTVYGTAINYVTLNHDGTVKKVYSIPFVELHYCSGHETLEEAMTCLEQNLEKLKEYIEPKMKETRLVHKMMEEMIGGGLRPLGFVMIGVEKMTAELLDVAEMIKAH